MDDNQKRWGINTHTFVLIFDKSMIPKEVKIGYCLKKIEQYILAALRCFKWSKYRHHKEICGRHLTCGRCGQKDPDHMEKDYPQKTKCSVKRTILYFWELAICTKNLKIILDLEYFHCKQTRDFHLDEILFLKTFFIKNAWICNFT